MDKTYKIHGAEAEGAVSTAEEIKKRLFEEPQLGALTSSENEVNDTGAEEASEDTPNDEVEVTQTYEQRTQALHAICEYVEQVLDFAHVQKEKEPLWLKMNELARSLRTDLYELSRILELKNPLEKKETDVQTKESVLTGRIKQNIEVFNRVRDDLEEKYVHTKEVTDDQVEAQSTPVEKPFDGNNLTKEEVISIESEITPSQAERRKNEAADVKERIEEVRRLAKEANFDGKFFDKDLDRLSELLLMDECSPEDEKEYQNLKESLKTKRHNLDLAVKNQKKEKEGAATSEKDESGAVSTTAERKENPIPIRIVGNERPEGKEINAAQENTFATQPEESSAEENTSATKPEETSAEEEVASKNRTENNVVDITHRFAHRGLQPDAINVTESPSTSTPKAPEVSNWDAQIKRDIEATPEANKEPEQGQKEVEGNVLASIEGYTTLSENQRKFVEQNFEKLAKSKEGDNEAFAAHLRTAAIQAYSEKTGKYNNLANSVVVQDEARKMAEALVNAAEAIPEVDVENGKAKSRYTAEKDFGDDVTNEEKEAIRKFNETARILEDGENHEQTLQNSFAKLRDSLHNMQIQHGKSEEEAMQYIVNLEKRVLFNRLLEANPDIERALSHIHDTDLWQQAAKELAKHEGTILAYGDATRTGAVSLLDSFAANTKWPTVSKVAVEGNSGSNAERQEVRESVVLAKKLDEIVKKLGSGHSDLEKINIKALEELIVQTEHGIVENSINFGSNLDRVRNQYELIQSLAIAKAKHSLEGTEKASFVKKLDEILDTNSQETSPAQKEKIRENILRGILYGKIFAEANELAKKSKQRVETNRASVASGVDSPLKQRALERSA